MEQNMIVYLILAVIVGFLLCQTSEKKEDFCAKCPCQHTCPYKQNCPHCRNCPFRQAQRRDCPSCLYKN